MKIKTMLFLILMLSACSTEKKQPLTTIEVSSTRTIKDYSDQIKHIKKFSLQNGYNTAVAFMVDYSLHSGKKRFFVIDLKKEEITKKALVCHGSCKGDSKNGALSKNFSNVNESLCTSLGMAVIGKRDYSQWGKKYKYWIDGLESSNSNMRKRVVVLHAWKHVPEKEVYPEPIVMSWGCPTVSIKFLDELDEILKENKKVLLYSFK